MTPKDRCFWPGKQTGRPRPAERLGFLSSAPGFHALDIGPICCR